MNCVGIIAEYNPFHNGHKWHLAKAKELSKCPYAIAVMSGNFVQRGEPAIFDKWSRAEMAVHSGIDLVIELPVVFAIRSAQYFAEGAIRLLHSLGIVKHVCFGAEHPEIATLTTAANTIDRPGIADKIHPLLKQGWTYAAALGKIIEEECNCLPEIISSPNNILAIEYLRAIKKAAPDLHPIIINRKMSNYHDTLITTPYASATAIRNKLLNGSMISLKAQGALPPSSIAIIDKMLKEKRGPITWSALSNVVLAKLRTSTLTDIACLPDVSEGLEYRIYESALKASDLNSFFKLLKSKRYTRARLQRIIVHALLGLNNAQTNSADLSGPLYARILAFNSNGRTILRQMRQKTRLPLITKTTYYLDSKRRLIGSLTPLQSMLAVDTMASDVYALAMPTPHWKKGGWDFRHSPAYISSPQRVDV